MHVKWTAGVILLLASGTVSGQDATSAAGSTEAATVDEGRSEADIALDTLFADPGTDPVEPDAGEADDTAKANPPDSAAPAGDDTTASPADVLPTIPLPQDPPPVPKSGDIEAPTQIEEIVVTATKREQSVREIPASITALSGADLEQSGAQGAQDFLKLVPGVNLTNDGVNAAQITIRGIASIAGTNPTTGLLFGDVSFSDFYAPRVTLDPNPFDLRSVEVLKGPQGTLFGAGALNGAVRYVPEPAKFGEWEAKYFAQYQWYEGGGAAPTYGAAVNMPIGSSDQWALRLMGFDRTSPGYVDNLGTGEDDANEVQQQGLRGILAWNPTQRWNLALTYATQRTNILDASQVDNADGRLERSNTPNPSPSDSRYHLADLRVDYTADWAEFVSETAYVRKVSHLNQDVQRALRGLVPVSRVETGESDTWSQELRMQSNADAGGDWQWVTGVSAVRQDYFVALDALVGTPGLPVAGLLTLLEPLFPGISSVTAPDGRASLLSIDADVDIEEIALFGDTTWHFHPDWELSLGGRFYRTSSGGPVRQGGLLLLASNGELESVNTDVVREQGFNPKISLLWNAAENLTTYATISRGFRVGGTQIGATTVVTPTKAPPVFKSDTIWNYEAGVRTDWLDNTLQFDFTVFYSDWTDPQAILPDASGLIVYYDNVSGVRSQGAEAAFKYRLPFGGLTFASSAAYTATVTTAPYVAPDGTNLPPGQAWPLAPRWQTATTLSHLNGWGDWTFGASVTHTYLGEAINNLARRQEIFGYSLVDAQINLANTAWQWMPDVALVMGNIADTRGRTNADGDPTDYIYLPPRSLILRLSGNF